MSKETNAAAVRQYVEAWNKGDASIFDRITTSDFVFHATGGGVDVDKEAELRNISNRTAFPDEASEIEDVVAEGDKVAIRTTSTGTQKGQSGNIAPTGKRVTNAQFKIFHLKDGKIKEVWSLMDRLSYFQQLGALPPTGEIGNK